VARYGFVIDLKRCYGCYSCQVACKAENHTPQGIDFAKCVPTEVGTFPSALRQMLPMVCMQCEDPPCMEVCPTGATTQDENGIVQVDKDKCMGCKYCMMACPYGSRQVVTEWKTYFPDAEGDLDPYEAYCKEEWQTGIRGFGMAAKCDYCMHRVREGRQPACVEACPAKARYFGDLDDPESEISILIRREGAFQLNPEFGTDPKCYYLPVR
jgi:molybdopterin-containing oxidoreductase family iron-sulfur binding subunit